MQPELAAVVVSVVAVLFTVGSFWWEHARLGRLIASTPQQYGSIIQDGTLVVRLPVVLLNTGARTIAVQTLRLRFLDGARRSLQWVAECDEMFSRDVRFRRAFAVRGPDSRDVILQFQRHEFENGERADAVRLQLEPIFLDQRSWKRLVEFSLPVPEGGFRPELSVIDLIGGVETGEA
jgi:hypothetical protein